MDTMKTAVVASKFKSNGTEIATHVSADLPSISRVAFDMNGAGVMGTVSVPVTGQFEAMELSINTRGFSGEAGRLMALGEQRLELLFSQDSHSVQKGIVPEGCKIYATGTFMKQESGSVVPGEASDGSVSFSVYRYEVYVAGKEVILIDQFKFIYRVNGKDLMEAVRKAIK